MKNILFILLSVIPFVLFAQKGQIAPPSITDKNEIESTIVDISFDEEKEDYAVKYYEGITGNGESHFVVNGLGWITRPVMVRVLAKDAPVTVKFVKPSWKDVMIEGVTEDGVFDAKFKTARQYGIILDAEQPETPYTLVISAGKENVNRHAVFYDDSKKTKNEKEETPVLSEEESDSTFGLPTMLILGALLLIILLLIALLFKRKGANMIVLLIISSFLLSSWSNNQGQQPNTTQTPSNQSPTRSPNPNAQPNFSQQVGEEMVGTPAKGLVSTVQALANYYGQGGSFNDLPFLNESDANYEPNMDPRGQPRLPSSCFEALDNNREEVRPEPSNPRSQPNRNTRPNNRPRNNDDSMDESSRLTEGTPPKKPIQDGWQEGTPPKKPTQDGWQEGTPPKKPSSTENTDAQPESPFVDEQGIDVEDDQKYRVDPKGEGQNNAQPESPFVDEQGIDVEDDQKHRLDSKEQGQKSKRKASSPKGKQSDDVGNNRRQGANSNEQGQNNRQRAPSPSSSSRAGGAEDGCECLEEAYRKFERNRYLFAKLKIIATTTKKDTDAAIAFGDNFSGIHAVSGLAWQTQRRKIVESLKGLDASYKTKYRELIDKLYNVLKEIDHCESILGNPGWYSRNGFIYYEFTKLFYETY